jgi:hypothetical protein
MGGQWFSSCGMHVSWDVLHSYCTSFSSCQGLWSTINQIAGQIEHAVLTASLKKRCNQPIYALFNGITTINGEVHNLATEVIIGGDISRHARGGIIRFRWTLHQMVQATKPRAALARSAMAQPITMLCGLKVLNCLHVISFLQISPMRACPWHTVNPGYGHLHPSPSPLQQTLIRHRWIIIMYKFILQFSKTRSEY